MVTLPLNRESRLEDYFSSYRMHIIGSQQHFESPFGVRRIIYADWTASGRCYGPIEDYIRREILPFVGNTHTGTTVTGSSMSKAYEEAKRIIKKHVNAGSDDVLIFCGSGMTAAVHKLQRIMGMRVPERIAAYTGKEWPPCDEALKPVVFVTAMEHHSNQTSWLETIADVAVIRMGEDGNVDMAHFGSLLEQHKHRVYKIAAVTACSNVTGIRTDYHGIAKLIHAYGGWCFVDFACAAPYCEMDMHPGENDAYLDAIYFSPHKLLGGPGTPGILIFNKHLYNNKIPDQPGGGALKYTNPWGLREYVANIEQREDSGTPPFLQGIKAAMCIRLKEEMGISNMLKREEELLATIFNRLPDMKYVQVLQANVTKRLGVVSFIVTGVHYNLITRLLNDRFGIQTRGGCSCAGTYGHVLLDVDKARSYAILDAIRSGDLSCKPGWVRLSIHPTMTNAEINFILDAIEITVANIHEWEKDYYYDHNSNEYFFKGEADGVGRKISEWFDVGRWQELT
ncbi:aminotransferase class V-fold PLP-dependent enzyme [Chitinophaga filiformis]|uniref:Aminotransferase class V-fold PLP-dependent enzyme n=1 Tax=Chitinophaga filiformis TaxID=104663 RepID=A0ABY4I509_CHIFI|nr:aminotransferase class V-fold PLP-dependent enzyme [Chitinophaga filiformis]UPK69826.1 aminotransferase class V-fold PLP-dependent enzyme [Chitinophaga filiformis]